MKIPFLPLTRIFFVTLAGISFTSLLLPQPSFAQLGEVDNRPGYDSQNNNNNSNPCSSTGQNFNMFNLIHCANFNNNSWDASQGNDSLNSAAAEYKKRQQQLLQGQQPQANPTNSTSPIITLPTTNPQSGK